MRTHEIKLDLRFCRAIASGKKNFDVRYDNRNFRAGDYIKFKPYVKENPWLAVEHEIENKTYQITYILRNCVALKKGYVVLGLKAVNNKADQNIGLRSLEDCRRDIVKITKIINDFDLEKDFRAIDDKILEINRSINRDIQKSVVSVTD